MRKSAGFRLLAAATLVGGLAFAAHAQDSTAPDCPEDDDTAPGCENTAPVSEPQPIPGAATAPLPADPETDQGDKTLAAPDADPADDDAETGADASATETDATATESAAPATEGDATETETGAADVPASDCPEDDDTAPGCGNEAPVSGSQPIEGAATAPIQSDGELDEGDKSMQAPDADPADGDAETGGTEGEATDSSGEQSGDASGASGGDPNIVVASEEDGRYWTAEDVPTFHVAEDGTVDWLTFSGFRRYHSECHVCHGPDGEGSSYAPALKNSAVNMDYYEFYSAVVNGIQHVDNVQNQVMPAFGDNQNVMCYLDDIYVYLKARGVDAIPRGRPAQKEAKSDMIQETENACMG